MPHRPAALAPALFVICWSLVLACTPGVSQAQSPTPPFDAVVIEANTMVRSGAGRAYYEVGSLEVGAEVVVEAELFGWYKIECPEGVYCFVERKNVNVRGDGSLGVIETDGTAINAAHATKGPADSYRKLMDLDAGDTVEIVDEVNNAYKIKPPKNAYVFLPPGSIEPAANRAPAPAPAEPVDPEPVTPTEPAPAPAETEQAPEPPAPVVVNPPVEPKPAPEPVVVNPPAPKPIDPEPVTPAPAPEPAPAEVVEAPLPEPEVISFDEAVDPVDDSTAEAKPVDLLNDPTVDVPIPDVEVQTDATNEMLRAVEVAMLPYLSLPVDEQPIAKMVKGYADASQIAQLSDSDMAIVRARLTQLERNRELASALAEADAVTEEINEGQPAASEAPATDPLADAETPSESETTDAGDSQTDAGDESASTEPKAPTPPAVPAVASEYDAVGILTASTVHTGANQPVLLRLLDPTGKRTVAYLEPSEAVDTVQMIGRIVGIVGESVYDPTTRLNLIRPTRVDVLSAN
ncbi:SH3 domain-containing protein [Algisphaera agarilytica]|uniref:SH3 domain-containing protein n=1 Tax=Algisphaera agarilytica TaxID=1385975 RepID=A0A7X0H503_9BACT|nr:hypothetical protein [Algisphaera agarilytica]MBB6429398.1 hypothetical protein [Algisphaera agarilytica]